LEQTNKFERDVFSLGFVFIFILAILTLQLLIEMKKRKVSREEQLVVQLAAVANRNLEVAQLQFQQKILKNVNHVSSVSHTDQSQQVSNNDALKVTRAVSLFGVLPSIIFIVTLSLENIDGLRPHATTAFSMFSYGVIAPSVLFCYNSKLQKFGKKFVALEIERWNLPRRTRQIQPIV
jgi:hypothetical protein